MALLARASGNTLQFSNNCFHKFSKNCVKLKWHVKSPCIFGKCKQTTINTKSFNTGPVSPNTKSKRYNVFDDVLSLRRDQARRSIVVQVQSEQSSYELYNYCSQFGTVEEMHHYTINGSVHFILIEFKSLSDINSMNSAFVYTNVQEHLPVISPMLWFRATKQNDRKLQLSQDMPLTIFNGTVFPTPEAVDERLLGAESISDQMVVLCNSTKLNDTETRLRFLTARQVETCLSGIFSNVEVLPFGSSVNGFGKHGCDLDLVLKLENGTKGNGKGRLVYHTKVLGANDRQQAQRTMVILSDIMHNFLPGIAHIRKILQARVPIIKYNQTLTGLECDLSMTNTIGIHMSELLYLYCEVDWRVRPLIFTIRMWAQSVKLTHSTPGNWITNFSLTLLVLFYLQQKQILPSVQQLVKLANKDDIRIADGCVDCTFLRDASRLPKSPWNNTESLEELLINFFIYYSSFDFATKAVSLNTATVLSKPDESNVFIYNPLEQGLNVTKNINIQETERLKIEMRNAAWLLDSAADNTNVEWGLLSLFYQKGQRAGVPVLDNRPRMVELSTLFSKSSDIEKASGASSKSESTNNDSGTVSKQAFRQAKDKENTSSSSSVKIKSGAPRESLERQGTSSGKIRSNRRLEWRR